MGYRLTEKGREALEGTDGGEVEVRSVLNGHWDYLGILALIDNDVPLLNVLKRRLAISNAVGETVPFREHFVNEFVGAINKLERQGYIESD